MVDLVEFVHAVWRGPSVLELKKLQDALPDDVKLVMLDADTVEYDPSFHGNGECRLNGGEWTTADVVLRKLEAR